MRFGHGGLVGFGYRPEAGAGSWLDHQDAGLCPASGLFARWAYWLRLNMAYNYINALRKYSNAPSWLLRMGRLERRLLDPLGHRSARSARVRHFRVRDQHVEEAVLPPALLAAMRDEMMHQPAYHDPAIPGWTYRGLVEAAPYSELYVPPEALFASDLFLEICTNSAIIAFCRELMGPRAAVSWAQAWIGNPGYLDSPKWKWHRNSSEPFNAVQVLIPLDDVLGLEDGPLLVLPGSSRKPLCLEPRLYGEEEVERLWPDLAPDMLLGTVGDVTFLNGFSLHRMMPALRRHATLAILVSLGPVESSPAILRRPLAQLPAHLRGIIAEHAAFFRRLVC